MTRFLIAMMLLHLILTGQYIWFWAFGGAVVVWELLQWDDRMYQKRTKKTTSR